MTISKIHNRQIGDFLKPCCNNQLGRFYHPPQLSQNLR
ncbi:hypothetical protein SPBRAN_778 [uncultured Candidatus Thioglobus sp.]|nr:hypothetical protein SPBRAN_778 [uncultured Candidatus Thioglobus sp.]